MIYYFLHPIAVIYLLLLHAETSFRSIALFHTFHSISPQKLYASVVLILFYLFYLCGHESGSVMKSGYGKADVVALGYVAVMTLFTHNRYSIALGVWRFKSGSHQPNSKRRASEPSWVKFCFCPKDKLTDSSRWWTKRGTIAKEWYKNLWLTFSHVVKWSYGQLARSRAGLHFLALSVCYLNCIMLLNEIHWVKTSVFSSRSRQENHIWIEK